MKAQRSNQTLANTWTSKMQQSLWALVLVCFVDPCLSGKLVSGKLFSLSSQEVGDSLDGTNPCPEGQYNVGIHTLKCIGGHPPPAAAAVC